MNENPRYRTLVSIIIGSTLTCFLGSGAVWSYLNNKHQDAILSLEKQVHTLEMEKADSQRKHNEGILLIENTKASLEIRKSKEKYFAIIIDLSKQYQKIRDQYSDSPSPRLNNDKSYTKRLLDICVENYIESEKKLAEIEGREPMGIRLNLVPPGKVRGVRNKSRTN